MNLPSNRQSRKDGKIVLLWLLGFFIVFASVDAFFVFKALSTNSGVVTENAYEKGLHFNKIIAEARKRNQEQNSDASKNSRP